MTRRARTQGRGRCRSSPARQARLRGAAAAAGRASGSGGLRGFGKLGRPRLADRIG